MDRRYLAVWKGPIEGYTVNFINKNLWRFQPDYEFLELVNESYLVFSKVRRNYANITTNPKWFMALYKTALHNRMHDISKSINRNLSYTDEELLLTAKVEHSDYLELLVSQAPDEVASVLSLFLKAPQELLDLAFKNWKSKGGKKATGNKFLHTILGLKTGDKSLAVMVRDYLKSDN